MQRSTQTRIASGESDPKATTVEAIVDHAGRYTAASKSTLTPLPLPYIPLSAGATVPVFHSDAGDLVGNFHSLAIHHRTGQGGTFLLAMLSLVAHGGGWDTWVVDPKRIDAGLYFPHRTRSASDDNSAEMLAEAAHEVHAGNRTRPLHISVDLTDHLLAQDNSQNVQEWLTTIITDGPEAGVFVNLAFTRPVTLPAAAQLTPVRLTAADFTTALVNDEPCRRPQLFVDYILSGDRSDLDFRRYLRWATA